MAGLDTWPGYVLHAWEQEDHRRCGQHPGVNIISLPLILLVCTVFIIIIIFLSALYGIVTSEREHYFYNPCWYCVFPNNHSLAFSWRSCIHFLSLMGCLLIDAHWLRPLGWLRKRVQRDDAWAATILVTEKKLNFTRRHWCDFLVNNSYCPCLSIYRRLSCETLLTGRTDTSH